MIFGTQFHGSISPRDLQSATRDIAEHLETLAGSIATGWQQQHDSEGGHGTVTCSGPCSCKQLRLTGFVELNLSGGSGGTPLQVPAGVAHVSIITPNSGSVFEIYGIKQVNQQPGDELFIRRSVRGADHIRFHDRAGASVVPVGTEIYLDSEVSGSYPGFTLTGLAPIRLVYLPALSTGNVSGAWCIAQSVSL